MSLTANHAKHANYWTGRTSLSNAVSFSVVRVIRGLTMVPAHQRIQQSFSPSGSTYDYTYDKIGQLKVADSAAASEDRGYVYDAAWNLNYRTNDSAVDTFNVDVKNQLTNTSMGYTYECTYDANGNLLTMPLSYGGQWHSYSYDDENRLIIWTYSGSGQPLNWWNQPQSPYDRITYFTYDGLGRLRQQVEYPADEYGSSWGGGVETRYIYDGWRVIQERDGSNVPTVSYTRGTDLSGSLEGAGGIGGLLARSHGYSGGNWSTHNFYHADGNGNITYLVNSSQTVAASYRYDPYGNTISSSGSLASANVYRFSSKEVHTGSGHYYYGERWYDPNLQRWLNRDPIMEKGGINLYQFALNNPINSSDSFGLSIDKPEPNTGGKGNCLSYALAPCLGAENPKGLGNFPPERQVTYEQMKKAVQKELEKAGCRKIKSKESCKPGEYEVNVFNWFDHEAKEPCYHAARQDSDGTWSDRRGPKMPVFKGYPDPKKIPGVPDNAKAPVKYCCPTKKP